MLFFRHMPSMCESDGDGVASGATPAGYRCSRSTKAIYGRARVDGGAEG